MIPVTIEFLSSWLGILASLAALGGFVSGVFALGKRYGKAKILEAERRELLKERLECIYAPLRAFLLNTHITSVSSMRYPYLRKRVKRFRASYGTIGLKYAVRHLFDRGVSKLSEVEFGVDLPLDKISEIASANARVADPELLNLIQRAERARYEDPYLGSSDLTPEDLSLVSHIWEHFDRLSKKLEGGV